ncbi:MAG: putative DNA repair exonuclease SbcD [Promethearchaeota archaeon]|nr:MAG: putative DNA repair exonuclease SbcD [Candidatus Lokiarchaeota archaeon]
MTSIKFAHLSDIHLGAWRNDTLNKVGYNAFEKAIDTIIEEKVDFVIISGDLYDVSNPKVDVVDIATKNLKKLQNNRIPVYGIMGSHDFSPSKKSMIRPLKSAELFIDVFDGTLSEENKLKLFFTQDPKTKVKFTGLRARKRSLEIEDYKILDKQFLEKEPGIKIFILHTMLSELKPKEFSKMESTAKSFLPQNFHYYAGGHIHKTIPHQLRRGKTLKVEEQNKYIYPGCLSPANFREIESFQYGGLCIVSGNINLENETADLAVEFVPIKIKEVSTLYIDCNNKSVSEVKNKIHKEISNLDIKDKILTIRLHGELRNGKTYEIRTNKIVNRLKKKGAYEVLINKLGLTSKEYASVSVKTGKTNQEIESELIKEHAEQLKFQDLSDKEVIDNIHNLFEVMGKEREENSKVKDYEQHLIEEFDKIFNLRELEGESAK